MIIIVFRKFPCLSLKHETLVVSWILSAVESSRSHPRPISCPESSLTERPFMVYTISASIESIFIYSPHDKK